MAGARSLTLSLLALNLLLLGALVPSAARAGDAEGPLAGFNQANRSFNYWLLDHVFEPVARGYNFVMPKWGQERLGNLFDNLERPRDFVNSLLQAKPARAGRHLTSFLVNSTVGLAGMFDVASHLVERESPETFNETLGVYRLPAGAYVILPVYGETCPRCLVGAVGDAVLNPLFWIPGSAGTAAAAGGRTLEGVNGLALLMPPRPASESEWDAYRERLRERPPYEESRRLFFDNQQLDVED